MKRLPRVPVWLILLPLAALALSAWFGPAAAESVMTARRAHTASAMAYAAAPTPGPGAAANHPTPGPQPTQACPPPGLNSREGREWQDLPWGGLWFDLADLEYNAAQDCAHHGHGPPPWGQGNGPPPWSHGWGHGHHGRFHGHNP